jgi:cell division protein FtsB
MDTERKIYGLLETVEQQQKNLSIAAAALEATRAAIAVLAREVKEASAAGASAGAAQALAHAGLLVSEAAGPTIAELKQATASVAQVQSTLRRATAWVSWQYLALIAAGCAALVLAVWIAVAWQRRELGELQDQKAALEAQIPTLQARVDALTAKGGKIALSECGSDKRRCVKVNIGMGTFGKPGESYMILDGY